jgi:hypothetical protein
MTNEQLIEELEAKRIATWNEWQALELLTFNDEYDEDYEDTVTRLTLDGTVTGLELAIDLIKNGASA